MTEAHPKENLTKHFYDRISGAYDLLADSNELAARKRGLTLLDFQPGEHVLEIGYGTGQSLVEIAKAVGPQGVVEGVDISEGMRRVAEKRLTEAGLAERVRIGVAQTPPLPYPDNAFNAVSLSFTLELFPLDVIPQVLAEVRRVLKPGGRVGVVSMALAKAGERDSVLETTYKWMHQHFPHIVDCQPIHVTEELSQAGFEIRHADDLEIWTMPVAVVVGVRPVE